MEALFGLQLSHRLSCPLLVTPHYRPKHVLSAAHFVMVTEAYKTPLTGAQLRHTIRRKK